MQVLTTNAKKAPSYHKHQCAKEKKSLVLLRNNSASEASSGIELIDTQATVLLCYLSAILSAFKTHPSASVLLSKVQRLITNEIRWILQILVVLSAVVLNFCTVLLTAQKVTLICEFYIFSVQYRHAYSAATVYKHMLLDRCDGCWRGKEWKR